MLSIVQNIAPARHVFVRSVVAVLIAVAASMVVIPSANAAPCPPVYDHLGRLINIGQECEGEQEEGGGDNDGNGGGQLSCDLTPDPPSWGEPTYTFCAGPDACTYEQLAPDFLDAPGHEALKQSLGPPPSPEHSLAVRWCRGPGDPAPYNAYLWLPPNAPGLGPSILQQALSAYDQLAVPPFTVQFSPPAAPATGSDAYFWAEFADPNQSGRIESGPALTLIAVAEPTKMTVDPGDPALAPFDCPWTLVQSEECTTSYLTASVDGVTMAGSVPAHEATLTVEYEVHFEPVGGGAPLTIPGLAPGDIAPLTDSATVPVPVEEIQALVTVQ